MWVTFVVSVFFTLSIVTTLCTSASTEYLTVDSLSGSLLLKRSLDREDLPDSRMKTRLLCGHCDIYDDTHSCLRLSGRQSSEIVINVVDLNDNGPVFKTQGEATQLMQYPPKNMSLRAEKVSASVQTRRRREIKQGINAMSVVLTVYTHKLVYPCVSISAGSKSCSGDVWRSGHDRSQLLRHHSGRRFRIFCSVTVYTFMVILIAHLGFVLNLYSHRHTMFGHFHNPHWLQATIASIISCRQIFLCFQYHPEAARTCFNWR